MLNRWAVRLADFVGPQMKVTWTSVTLSSVMGCLSWLFPLTNATRLIEQLVPLTDGHFG